MATDASSSATGLQMDEFLEILNMPSWSDIGGLRNQLEFNTTGVPELGLTPVEGTSSLCPVESGKQANDFQDVVGNHVGEYMDFRQQDDSFLSSQLQNQNQNQLMSMSMDNPVVSTLGVNCNVNQGTPSTFSSMLHPASEGNVINPGANPMGSFGYESRMWRQPYIGDLQQQLLKPDVFLNGSNPLFSTRYRSPIPSNLRLHREGARGVFNAYGLGQQKPPLQANSRGSYRNTQPAPIAPLSGAPRPRVRARRGQATDPHSIAERQRRERIAERMKDLQGLVPNVNKTDKAIMLDEIIEYVKFLQLQSKIFSMCRMGSSGSVPCNLPPSEYSSAMAASLGQSSGASAENLASLEHQVARLMDDSMGSALQFLQSKGFCLMPVSMAAALSATKPIHQPIFSGDKSTETSTIVTERPSGN